MDKFYLGTHIPGWLWNRDNTVPLFVSQRTLSKYATLKPASCRWALDSGGFSELSMYGQWITSPDTYIKDVRDYNHLIGNLDWAAPQDWMCEPQIIAKTWLTTYEHQVLTVQNFKYLLTNAPDIKWRPVIQGFDIDEYEDCIDMYYDAGIDLTMYDTVGVGSICRRQSTNQICEIIDMISAREIKIHAFGVSNRGLPLYHEKITSADSLAWSRFGRYNPTLSASEHCRDTHINCANCYPFSMIWKDNLLDGLNNKQIDITRGYHIEAKDLE
jgi:hypothetical protein